MDIRLMAEGGFEFSQTDEWPMDPKQDYPMVPEAPPVKQWHFTGRVIDPVKETIIAALMSIESGQVSPQVEMVEKGSAKIIAISAMFEGGNKADIQLNLGTDLESKRDHGLR